MAFSIHTLTSAARGAGANSSTRKSIGNTATDPPKSVLARYAQELFLLAGFVALVFWILSLATYALQDAAWSTSGEGGRTLNKGGVLGAWLADLSYYLLGFSVWWVLAAGLRAWLAALAAWLRGGGDEAYAPPKAISSSWVKFVGLCLLLAASACLEWVRFFSWESHLPGHGGGV
ncbi:MAG: DNA translocase FtsK, partial [Betaproteobacteria bacterium]|nr:DNA translocase FtsK [Betaproteobacteria bacterium]